MGTRVLSIDHRDPYLDLPIVDAKEPLLSEFDELHAPPPAEQPSLWQRWRGAALSAIGAAGSIALRAANLSAISNGISCLTAGFSLQSLIDSSFPNLPRIRQVCLTAFGQTLLFALTQAFSNIDRHLDNDEAAEARLILTQAVIAQLGANAETLLRWLYQEGAIRAESRPLPDQKGTKLHHTNALSVLLSRIPRLPASIDFYHKYTEVSIRLLKGLAAPAALIGRISITDPILGGLTGFFGGFYASQAFGETIVDGLDQVIQKHDSPQEGTRFRTAKTALLTLSYLALPLCAIPWVDPETQQRTDQLLYVGVVLGFFDGIATRSSTRRIQHIPIESLEEFHTLPSPQPTTLCRRLAYRIVIYATPTLSLLGFSIWQQVAELSDADSEAALWSIFTGGTLSYIGGKAIDTYWSPKNRSRFLDYLMTSLWASPRILGINPLYLYYAGTNSLNLDGLSIHQQSPLHRLMIVTAWTCYGISMGRELVITTSSRIGNPLLKCPHMVLMNGTIETYLYMKHLVRNLRYP